MRLRSQRIVTPTGPLDGEVVVEDGVIIAVGPGGRGGPVVDLGRHWLVPGYIDGHVHGGGGGQFNTSDPDEIRAVARFHARHGTTALLATTVSAPIDELTTTLATIAGCERPADGAAVLGAHLEGPFLSPHRPGAMDPATFREPEPGALERLLRTGIVRVMTVAPELPRALEVIARLVAADAVASMGHSEATYEQARAAADAGARAATHLFNAMPPLHHRSPGLVGAALDLSEISCELIGDGVHADPAALRLAYRAKGPAGIRLVTDAMSAAGMPDGTYRLGAASVEVRDGRATLAGGSPIGPGPTTGASPIAGGGPTTGGSPTTGGGPIAGSTLTMEEAVRNAVRFLGIGVEEASVLASGNPARLLGIAHRTGAIAPGLNADLVVLDDDLRVRATLIAGRWAFNSL